MAWLAILPAIASAQGGWVTEKHPDLGLTFPRARNYDPIPTPPDDEHRVLYFAEKVPENAKQRKAIRPELNVLWIDKAPDAGQGTVPEGDPGHRRPIDGISRFVEDRLSKWDLGQPAEGKPRDGYAAKEYTLTPRRELHESGAGWVYAYQNELRTIAFLGLCDEKDLKEQMRIWRYSAEHAEFAEPEEPSTGTLERMYARLALPGPGFRIAVRKKLVRGWKAEDTQHYIVIYDTPDQPLVRKIVRDLELLNAEYQKLFPPLVQADAVSTVRVCKSREEYLSYGGEPHTAGYWNSAAEELVVFDAETIERHVRSDADTFVALYHEAFHQYIHHSSGELPPHPWFNEGHGDFFSGATVKDGKVRSIGVNPWRVDTVKLMIEVGKTIPWKEIVRFEQKQYYDPETVALCYAEGWSMIYFLRKSKLVEKRPEWARILPTYFATLKSSYAEGLAALDATGKKGDKAAIAKAGLEAREKALAAAFDGVDIDQIEAAWIEFVRTLEIPKHG